MKTRAVAKSPLKIIALGVALWAGAFCGQCVAQINSPAGNFAAVAGAPAVVPIAWVGPFTESLAYVDLQKVAPQYRDILGVVKYLDLKQPSMMRIVAPIFSRLESLNLTPETFGKLEPRERRQAVLKAVSKVVSDAEREAEVVLRRLRKKDLGQNELSSIASELGKLQLDYSIYLSPSRREAVSDNLTRLREKLGVTRSAQMESRIIEMAEQMGIPVLDVPSNGNPDKARSFASSFESVAPEPRLKRLRTMTDDTGVFEHAIGPDPDKKHGYCAEDVGRALVAVLMFNKKRPGDETASVLAKIYMSYLHYSQRKNGNFHHRMDAKRRLSKQMVTADAFGRVLWGLGYAVAYPMNHGMGAFAKEMFDKALPQIGKFRWPWGKAHYKLRLFHSPRGIVCDKVKRAVAYTMFGLHYYLKRFPESPEVKKTMISLADALVRLYKKNSSSDWQWFENTITFDNAKLPHALLLAYESTGKKIYLDVAKKTLDFLIGVNFPDGNMMEVIGNIGWFKRGRTPARFDQQPVDAAAMVEVCALAYRILGFEKYKRYMKLAFEWFLGKNALGKMVYDSLTGGSRNGVNSDKVNPNQGAESSIEFLIALLMLRQVLGI